MGDSADILLWVGVGGLKIEGEDDSYDFGTGAGFYVDATKEPWNKGYKMYSYITQELPKALWETFEQLDGERVSITGHSMGGHGALTMVSRCFSFVVVGCVEGVVGLLVLMLGGGQFLKNPGMYKSVSAIAPIANPINCSWGHKAFTGYFGEDENVWKEHDASELVQRWDGMLHVLIDVVCLPSKPAGWIG